MDQPWPFDQPPNCAVVTTTHVMQGRAPITRVYHNEDDHGWQFHANIGTRAADAMLVALKEVVALDDSVLEMADLPPGWMAVRESFGSPWKRMPYIESLTKVVIDWSTIRSKDEFYDHILPQCGSPDWHGRNLDALNDSWVNGGIDLNGPPYVFEIKGVARVAADLADFRDVVREIAEESVSENGGELVELK